MDGKRHHEAESWQYVIGFYLRRSIGESHLVLYSEQTEQGMTLWRVMKQDSQGDRKSLGLSLIISIKRTCGRDEELRALG